MTAGRAQDGYRLYDTHLQGGAVANTEALTGNKTLVDADAQVQFLDPGGSSRNITLPAETDTNHPFFIFNTADAAENLVIKNDAAATILTIYENMAGAVFSDGTTWLGYGFVPEMSGDADDALRGDGTFGALESPSEAFMFHYNARVTAGNAIATTLITSATHRHGLYSFQNAAANADTFTHSISLAAGTYTFTVFGLSSTNCGKIDWTLDGTAIGTQDWYSDPLAYNVSKSVASFIVATSGVHTLQGKLNGKNGGSSDYFAILTTYWFVLE